MKKRSTKLPKRMYMEGESKPLSVRVPKQLKTELALLAKEQGWKLTDLVITLLDQYVQQERNQT